MANEAEMVICRQGHPMGIGIQGDFFYQADKNPNGTGVQPASSYINRVIGSCGGEPLSKDAVQQVVGPSDTVDIIVSDHFTVASGGVEATSGHAANYHAIDLSESRDITSAVGSYISFNQGNLSITPRIYPSHLSPSDYPYTLDYDYRPFWKLRKGLWRLQWRVTLNLTSSYEMRCQSYGSLNSSDGGGGTQYIRSVTSAAAGTYSHDDYVYFPAHAFWEVFIRIYTYAGSAGIGVYCEATRQGV